MKVKPEIEKLLEKAKLRMMMTKGSMFFTTILFSLKYSWSDKFPTAAVDGKHMYVNPDFFEKLSGPERIGVLVHEVLHVALQHITRGFKHDHLISNYAADYVCNLMVKDAGYVLPSSCLYDEKYRDMSYEQVYAILIKQQKKGEIFGIAIPGTGADIKVPKNPVDNASVQQDIADIVLRATSQAKASGAGYGNIPGEVLVELDNVINPKLPWHVIFQNYMNNFAKNDYSYRRPNKKYLPDLYMPSAHSEAICNIVEAVDSSGSVSKEEFSFFISETAVIQETLRPDKITVIDFDTKIRDVQPITQSTNILNDLTFTGRGGTNIEPVLKWAAENNPEVMIVFTDGDFRQPPADEYPSCPIVWLIHNNPEFNIPYGEVIHYEI